MNRVVRVPFVLAAVLFASSAFAGSSATQTVTVTVDPINEISATGSVALHLTTGTSTGITSVSDSTTADLAWTTNEDAKKITVATSVAESSQKYTLTVEAISPTSGASAGPIALTTGASAQDLVTGIGLSSGSADLTYSASATAAAGTGTDTHTVTFTITAE